MNASTDKEAAIMDINALRKETSKRWSEVNAKGIANYDRHIKENGIWSDGLRVW